MSTTYRIHVSMNLLMMCLWILISLIQNNSAQTQEKKQQECRARSASPLDLQLIPKLSKEWYVARATLRTLLRKGQSPPTLNSCTAMTNFETCQGAMYVEREWSTDGKSVKKMTRAYSKEYDNIAEFWEDQKLMDPDFFIWKGTALSMKLHFKDGGSEEIPLSEAPVVANALARVPALITYGSSKETGQVYWTLYQDCDEDFAFVEIAEFVFDDPNLLDEVNKNIDEFLQEPPIPLLVPQMVKLPTTLPF